MYLNQKYNFLNMAKIKTNSNTRTKAIQKFMPGKRVMFYSFLGLWFFIFSSCEDVLEEKSYSKITSANFYEDAEAAEAAINGCYRGACAWGTFGFHGHKMAELASDISDGLTAVETYSHAKYDASSESVRFGWIGWYTIIHRCNTVLERVPPIKMNEKLKKRILAEAKFLRAWSNLCLVRLYGDIPLRKQSAQTPEMIDLPRTPTEDVYNFIIEDLKYAENNLWPEYTGADKGRANIDAAKTLLSITYMTMAGKPLEKGEEMWIKAKNKAWEVIEDRGGIPAPHDALANEYGNLFATDYENKYHSEKLFFINHVNINDLGTPLTHLYAATDDYGPSNGATMWHSEHFYNSFEPEDERAIQGFKHIYTSGGGATTYFWPDTTGNNGLVPGINEAPPDGATLGNHPYSAKYDDPNATTKTNSASPINILRYAETLLIFAETENEINGPTKNAYAAINSVRQRANLPKLQLLMDDSTSKSEFREKLLMERAHEFFGENKRRFDLIRTGTFIEKMNEAGRNVSKAHLLFPIPLEEILGNTKISQNDQNPGW